MSVRHNRRGHRTWLIGVAASGLFVGLAIVGVPAQATSVGGLFELDGNPQLSVAAGDDWETFYNTADSNDPLATFVTSTSVPIVDGDSSSNPADASYFTGGGSKDVRDVSAWRHSTGDVAPDKDEIMNAFAAAYRADTDDAGDAEELIVFFGSDRFANSGDAQMGFWFFKNSISKGPNGTFTGVHANGDILVLSDFSGGGKVSTMSAYTWQSGKLQALNVGNNVVDCSTGGHNADLCATENGGLVDSLWPYQPKAGAANKYPTGSFLEGGINVTHLLPTTDGCFASFLAETRSSTSPSAQLKDFALGGFPVCNSSTSLNDTAASADPTVAHSDEPVELTFYESNDGETRLSNPNLTSTDTACNDSMAYASGDTNTDGYLDPGEEWVFTCTTSSDAAGTTVTIDATGHGTNPSGKDVTFWDDCTEGEIDNGRVCDLEEYTTVDFEVINPSTTLTKTASAEVTYTYKEKNDGNGDIDNVVVTDDNCTNVVPTESGGYNVGDDNSDGVLNPDEEWTFTCTATINGSAPAAGEDVGTSVTNTATGSGDDGTGDEVTWCDPADDPPADTYCSQGEQDSVTVTITEHEGVNGQ